MENNLIKELPLRGSWHGAAVTEGVRQARARYRNLHKISDLLIYCYSPRILALFSGKTTQRTCPLIILRSSAPTIGLRLSLLLLRLSPITK